MFRHRYDELINSFEHIAFDHINVRVFNYLKKVASKETTNTITISHQDLASELGTTRVVISRILKDYEKQKMIRLFRGRIELMV